MFLCIVELLYFYGRSCLGRLDELGKFNRENWSVKRKIICFWQRKEGQSALGLQCVSCDLGGLDGKF